MKKIILIILLVALPIGIKAQTFPVDPMLDSVRTFAFYELNIPTAGTGNVTVVKANYLINKSLGKLCSDLPAYQKIDTLYMTSDSDGVVLPADLDRIASAFRSYDGMLIPMKRVPHDTLRTLFVTDSSANSQNKISYASPNYYRTFSRKFFTQPVVSMADTFVVYYYAVHPELTALDSLQFEPTFFDEFMLLVKAEIQQLRE